MRSNLNTNNSLGKLDRKKPFVVSLSNHEQPFAKALLSEVEGLRANGFEVNGLVENITQRGFSMIEILITLVIIAVAMLGTAGLQLNAMKLNKGSQSRTQAIFLAADIAERMEANKAGAIAGNYELNTLTSAVSTTTTDCASNACSAADLAAWDIKQWELAIQGDNGDLALPSAEWKIVRTADADCPAAVTGNPSTYCIFIRWVERRTDQNYAVNNSAFGTGESFSYTAIRTIGN